MTFLDHLLKNRGRYFVATAMLLVIMSTQLLHVAFNGNVNVMFDPNDVYFKRLKQLDSEYAESNYLIVLFEPANKTLYDPDNLKAVEELTQAMWQIPYSIRVDSLTNHQRLSVDGDNLSITDLVEGGDQLSEEQINGIREYARSDSQISGRMVSPNENSTALFATIALPKDHMNAVLEVGRYSQSIKDDFEQRYPGSSVYLNGDVAIEHALLQVTMDDIFRVNPVVFITIFLLVGVFLRSVMAIAATLGVVIAATGISSGVHVLLGFEMNPITMMSSAVIMVLAVADSIHVLTIYQIRLRQQFTPSQAMLYSLQKNISPIFWTSVTTAVGFLGMNFGDSPPFRTMGNMAAIGVVFAFIATFTVLPAIALWFPVKPQTTEFSMASWMQRLSRWVIGTRRTLLLLVFVLVAFLGSFIPNLKVNDDISEYFDPSLPMYDSVQFAKQNTNGVQYILYSMDSGVENGINNPQFLNKIDAFADWVRQQEGVTGVTSYVDLLKKLNQTMNGDDPAYYSIPDDPKLCSQYLLLYEISLPPGIDLTRDLTMDRSALKLTVNIRDSDNEALIELEEKIDIWLKANSPELHNQGTSQLLMFAHMGSTIIHSMIDGSLFTLAFISIFMIFALRSFKFGLLSLIPNLFPPIVVYGIWSLVVGQVNHAAAMTFSICLGLVVDDTIHFISKYLNARREGYSPEQSIEQSFVTSGTAIVITSVTLASGVLLLTLSNFTVNDTMSLMLAGIVITALIFDLLFLPSLLLWVDKAEGENDKTINESVCGNVKV